PRRRPWRAAAPRPLSPGRARARCRACRFEGSWTLGGLAPSGVEGLVPSGAEGLLVLLQLEESIDRFRVGGLRLFVRKRLQLVGRLDEQLLDDQPRDVVDSRTRLRRERAKLALEALKLRHTDRFESLPQCDDGRDR